MSDVSELSTPEARRPSSFSLHHLVGALAVFTLTFIRYGSHLRDWWSFDDPYLLIQTSNYTLRELLFTGEALRGLSNSNFTPLYAMSLRLDYLLAGYSPQAFHLHQLLASSLAIGTFFLVMSRTTNPITGWLASVALLGAPVWVHMSRMIMVRHYVEGLILALAAFLVWQLSYRRSHFIVWIASFLYFLAILCKEIYAPLPLLFFASDYFRVPKSNLVRRFVPPTIAGVVYLLWRLQVLGSLGGYGPIIGWQHIAKLPGAIFVLVSGNGPIALRMTAGLLVLVVLAIGIVRIRRLPMYFILALVMVMLPLVPLAPPLIAGGDWNLRYGLIAVVITIGGISMVCNHVLGSVRTAAVLITLAITFWSQGFLLEREQRRFFDRMSKEGQYLWTAPGNAPQLVSRFYGLFPRGVVHLRRVAGLGEAPSIILSDYALLNSDAGRRQIEYNERSGELEPIRPAAIEWRRARLLRQHADLGSLQLFLSRRGSELRWEFSPKSYDYSLVSWPDGDILPVNSSDWMRVPAMMPDSASEILKAPFPIRVVARRLGGAWTMSPTILLPSPGESTRWAGTPPSSTSGTDSRVAFVARSRP